LVSTQS